MRYKEKQQCWDTAEMTALSFSRTKIPIAFSWTEITEKSQFQNQGRWAQRHSEGDRGHSCPKKVEQRPRLYRPVTPPTKVVRCF